MIDIERLAREAGPGLATLADIDGWPVQLQRFADLVLEEAAKVAEEKYQEMASKGFPREASAARALAKTYRSIKQNL
jgi:hypothetical protein